MAEPDPKEPVKETTPAAAGAPAVTLPAAPVPANDPVQTVFNIKAALAETGEASAFPRAPLHFPIRKVFTESRESSVFPRVVAKDNGFHKFLRFLGMGDIVDATRQPKNKGHLLGQAISTKIGFGDIFRAARQPRGKVRGTLKAIGSKIADMAAGRLVSGSFKLIAITFVAGMLGGVSGWGSICLLALATGASSAIYTYGKNYVTEKIALPKSQRSKVKIFDKNRALDALKAFGSGAANGAFGLWLANLPVFQHVMKYLHGLIHDGIGQISKPFAADGQTKAGFTALDRNITGVFNAATPPAPDAGTVAAPKILPPLKPPGLGG